MLFVKDQNPEKPNYFLFRDNIDTELPSDWNIWCLAESMELGNNTIEAHFKGKYDVNLDVYSLIPDKNIVTGAYGPTESVYGFYRQKLYQLQQNSGGNYMVLLYPRLRNEKQPEVKAWGISGTCIRTNTWTHYVVLSNQPVNVQEADATFQGKVGVLRRDGHTRSITLLSADGGKAHSSMA